MLTSATTNQSQCDPSTTNTSSSSISNQPTGLCLVFFNARCTIHTIFQSLEAQCAPYIPGSESIPASKSFTLKQRFTFKSKSQLRWYAIARCAIRTTFQEVNPFRHQSLWNNDPLLRRHRSEAQVEAYSGKWIHSGIEVFETTVSKRRVALNLFLSVSHWNGEGDQEVTSSGIHKPKLQNLGHASHWHH